MGDDFHRFAPGDHLRERGSNIGPRFDIISVILFLVTWSTSTALRIIDEWRRTEKRALIAEAEKSQAELSFLKAQIHPHFLFNTLNNIYSMSVSSNPKTPEAIMKLSNIMRYVTDESATRYVSLRHEISSLMDYIDLQKIRLSDRVPIDAEFPDETGTHQIAPFLLLTFIENAFKYGVSVHDPHPIAISIVLDGNLLHFTCRNKKYPAQAQRERTGIGLENTKRRLAHLYPGKWKLNIDEANGLYDVRLDLELS
jgi:LytS/YehU family sensor histidine kinase